MKKVLLALALSLGLVGVASAADVDLNAGGISGGNAGGIVGVTVGDHFGKFGVDAGFAQGWQQVTTTNRWTLVGGYDVATIADVTITPKVGYAYLNNSSTVSYDRTPSASAALVGLGASYPITPVIAATADYAYQFSGNSRNTGNVLTAGVKYSF